MARKTSNEVLERRIREAFAHVTPNAPSSALSACDQSVGKGRILMTTQGKGRIAPIVRRVAGIAAALVLTCGVAVGVYSYQANVAVASTVSLDVNPSVEITTNKNEKVLSVTALNADGEIIIGDMSLKGSDLDVAVNALVGSMVQNGYINEVSNSILLTVDGKNEEKNAVIREKLVEKINEVLKTDALDGAVLSQTIGTDETVKELAEEHGISKGKAQLIRQITLQNTRYSFEDLVKLTINELNLLSESGATKLENVDLSGIASDKKYIGEEAALAAALAHAEVAEADMTDLECEMDFEHGKMVYEIEFLCGDYEYEYTVDAESGEIVKQSKKLPHGHEHGEGAENGNKPEEVGCAETHITAEDALAKALAHAGIAADAALEDTESKLSRKRGECVYKVEFELDGYEYEYLIDASTGDVIKYEKELEDEDKDKDNEKPEKPEKPAESKPEHDEIDGDHGHKGEQTGKPEDDKHEKPEDGKGEQNGKPEHDDLDDDRDDRDDCGDHDEKDEDDEDDEDNEDDEDDEDDDRGHKGEQNGKFECESGECPEDMTRPEKPGDDKHEKPENGEGKQNGKPEGGKPECESGECHEDMTRPEKPECESGECHEDMTRPEKPECESGECHEDMTRPEKPECESGECHEDMTRPEKPECESGVCPEDMTRPEKPEVEESIRPEKPEMPEGEESARPEKPEIPEGEESVRPEKPEMPEGEESARPEKPEIPEGEESVRPEKPEMPEGEESAKPEKPEMPEGEESVRPEKPEMSEDEQPVIPEENADAVPQEENGDFDLQPMRR